MTLANTLLMPQAFLPLYLFEPKYCKMLNDVLDDHRMFAVALAKKIHPTKRFSVPYSMIGIGVARACVKNSDGTFHLILQGIARAKILHITQEIPYRMAQVKVMPSRETMSVETEALMLKVIELILERIEKLNLCSSHKMFQFLKDLKDPDIFSDIISYNFVNNLQQRQKLLETLDVQQRLRELILIFNQEASTSSARSTFTSPK